jgi:hypothetical protein
MLSQNYGDRPWTDPFGNLGDLRLGCLDGCPKFGGCENGIPKSVEAKVSATGEVGIQVVHQVSRVNLAHCGIWML